MEILKQENIPTVVWLCPILPYITDTKENISSIIDACIKADVKGIICFGMGMTLRDGNREYYYKKLEENFPGIKEVYEKGGYPYVKLGDSRINSQLLLGVSEDQLEAQNDFELYQMMHLIS